MRHNIVVEKVGDTIILLIIDKENYLSEPSHKIGLTLEEAYYLRSELEYILGKSNSKKE